MVHIQHNSEWQRWTGKRFMGSISPLYLWMHLSWRTQNRSSVSGYKLATKRMTFDSLRAECSDLQTMDPKFRFVSASWCAITARPPLRTTKASSPSVSTLTSTASCWRSSTTTISSWQQPRQAWRVLIGQLTYHFSALARTGWKLVLCGCCDLINAECGHVFCTIT